MDMLFCCEITKKLLMWFCLLFNIDSYFSTFYKRIKQSLKTLLNNNRKTQAVKYYWRVIKKKTGL